MASVLTEETLTVDELLRLPKEIRSTLFSVMEQLHEARYTGPVTFHFHAGLPRTIQLLPPQIRLTD